MEEALANKTPLPQFLPSSRIAHMRVVNRVREILAFERNSSRPGSRPLSRQSSRRDNVNNQLEVKQLGNQDAIPSMIKRKYMSWSASSTALEEIVEYVEELVELVKLIVGVNEFRHGFLSRPLLYEDWAAGATDENSTNDRTVEKTVDSKLTSRRGSQNENNTSSGVGIEDPIFMNIDTSNNDDENYVPPRKLRKRAYSLIGELPSISQNEHPMDSISVPHLVVTTNDSTEASGKSGGPGMPISMKRIVMRKNKKK